MDTEDGDQMEIRAADDPLNRKCIWQHVCSFPVLAPMK